MSKHDTIIEVAKTFDEIIEIEKFNPFHDARGRFASSNGFKSYSANPNTRAGAMAIARSAAAGHGNTANVHRESYGENIQQNAKWMGSGKGLGRGNTGYSHLKNRTERLVGLAGASRTGAAWQQQNQQQGRTTKPGKQTQQNQQTQQQTATKPAQQPKQTQTNQQAQQQNNAAQNNARKPVDGKDISSTFKYNNRAKGEPLDQVADQQGFKNKPTLISDSTEFSAAVKASGVMAYRTLGNGTDVVTGQRKTGAQFADDLKNSDNFSHNGTGGKVYGGGIYIAATKNPVQGQAPSRNDTNYAKSDSRGYGWSGGAKTVAMTLQPNAKIGDYSTVRSAFNRLSSSQKAKYGNDMAAYAASKGYDGLRAKNAGVGCDYITVYNRSKIIIYDN